MTESVGRVCALVQAVEPLGEVWVVAPDQEMSGVSHAITLGKPCASQASKGGRAGLRCRGRRRIVSTLRSITS